MLRPMILAASLFALSILLSCGPPSGGIQVGEPLQRLELPDLDGQIIALDSFRGHPMILNFWATWCGPCRYEMPTLQAIARATDVVVVGISLDEGGSDEVRSFVEREGLDYTILLGDRELFLNLGGSAIPYTLVLDASHTVVRAYSGVVSERMLERDLQRLKS